ncbi:MAG: tripartite tricarboxylate transporter substrate binding protein [Betaproteobacteria bacterium]
MPGIKIRPFLTIACCALTLPVGLNANAQSWPTKQVRFIAPFPPGGGTDITCRVIAPKLADALGQPVIVDIRGGAGGMIGVEIAAKSAPDGYTMVLGTIGPMAINPNLYSKMPYDPVKDLMPVTLAADALIVLVVHPALPVKNVKELVALGKARPNQLFFGSSGPGATDHLAGELFNLLAGTKMVHVPYKGGAPVMIDLMAGNVQLIFSTVSTAIGQIKSGRFRALAMMGTKRFVLMPELPTIAEAGAAGFAVNNWYGLFVPAGTPKEIVTRLNTEIVKILHMPDVKQKLLDSGIEATSNTPEQFAAYAQAETKKWAKVVKEANVKVD